VLLHGRLLGVSTDAITRDKTPRGLPCALSATDRSTNEPKRQEPIYAARGALDRTWMQIEGKSLPLRSGMAATVEIKTCARRIISHLISPHPRYRQESPRARWEEAAQIKSSCPGSRINTKWNASQNWAWNHYTIEIIS
jgi:membrane fusion protein, hemolysin D